MRNFVPNVPATAMPGVPLRYRARKNLKLSGEEVPAGTLLTLEQVTQFSPRRLQTMVATRHIVMLSLEDSLALMEKPKPQAQPVVTTDAHKTASTKPQVRKRR